MRAACLTSPRSLSAGSRLSHPAFRRQLKTSAAMNFLSGLVSPSQRKPDADSRTDLPAPSPGVSPSATNLRMATFAGGCFWVRFA